MPKGLEWVGSTPYDSGMVRVLLDDQKTTELRPAVDYAVSGLKPFIFELPLGKPKPQGTPS